MNPGLDHGWWPWVALILFGFLPSEVWRIASIFVSRGLDERSPLLHWARAVATALLAGVVAKLLLEPNGGLAMIPFTARLGAMGVGLLGFVLGRKSVFAGVLAAEVAIVGFGYWHGG